MESGVASDFWRNLSTTESSEIPILIKRRKKYAASNPKKITQDMPIARKQVSSPKWDVRKKEFRLFMVGLNIRIETEMAQYLDLSSIYLDMIDTFSEDKRFRVAH